MDTNEQIQFQQYFVTGDGKRFPTELEAKLHLMRVKHLARAMRYVEAKGTLQGAASTRLANTIAEFLAFEEMATDMPAATQA